MAIQIFKNPVGLKTSIAPNFLGWLMELKKNGQGLLYLILSMHSTFVSHSEVHLKAKELSGQYSGFKIPMYTSNIYLQYCIPSYRIRHILQTTKT